MSEQQQPTGWRDDERVRRWIDGAAQRELQMEPVSDELFAAADLRAGERVLDVGCGTGPTTIRAAAMVGPSGRVLGADIAPAMIEAARSAHATSPEARQLDWLVGDVQSYAFREGVFDTVISRFGVMFFPDPLAAFTNLARATKARGRLTMAVWQTRDHVPLFDIPYEVAAAVLDQRGIAYEPVPIDDSQCSLGSHERVAALLEPAGWRDVTTHPTSSYLHVGGLLDPAEASRQALDIGPIRGLLDGQPDEIRDEVRGALAERYAPLYDGLGVAVPAGFMIVTARR